MIIHRPEMIRPDQILAQMSGGMSNYQRTREMGLNEMLLENRCVFLDMPLDPSLYHQSRHNMPR